MKLMNETIKKLTTKEMNDLGCYNIGICMVKGKAKCRVKGCKTTKKTDDGIHYETEKFRFELIKTADKMDNAGRFSYAVRWFNKEKDEYEKWFPILSAVGFVKN